ncbi:hypothetical protein BG011_007955 [Mortierella polycephala]|uniref:Importin N-terminal domain-containing protein n=1 Tax=Mortierella polycephala TaxID=41804 RepID=A0A9P6TXJ6_9FUNG|nr:hypothetical protein BG011_007955 [Mortierella polycephala]
MDQTVFQVLTDTLSSDANMRMAAELQLKELQANPEYPISLSRLALARECIMSQRHSAAVLLKSYIDKQWSPKSPKFRGPEPPAEAFVVSKIAHLDWPDAWPNLLDALMHRLKSGSADEVHGSMRVLAEIISKDISHVQLPVIAPVLFPELLRILSSDQIYSHTTRSRCVSIFRSAVDMLHTIKEEHSEAVKAYLTPIFSQWNDVFMTVLNTRTTEVPEIEVAEWGLKTEIIKCINLSIQGFPKLTASYILPVLSAVWQDIVQLRLRYLRENVGCDAATGHTFQDSDGENIGFEALLFVQFEFIQSACRRKKLTSTAFVGQDGTSGIIQELVWNTLSYMQMTDAQAETWNSDPNQFIAGDEYDSSSFNVRIAAQEVLLTLVDHYEQQTINALGQAVNREMADSISQKANGNANWWKPQESSLLAVGILARYICDSINSGTPLSVDIGSLFDHAVLANLSAHDFPFLQGRSFVFSSQFALVLPSDLAPQYVSATVEAILGSPSAVVKVSALKALNNFNRYLDKIFIAAHQRSLLQGVAPMIGITTEETFSLIVRTLIATSKVDEQVTAEFENILGPLVLESWLKCPAENSMSADVMDLFDALAANPYMNPAFSARAMPVLVNMISPENPDKGMVAAAVDLIKSLIQGGPSPPPPGFVNLYFPRMMGLLLGTDDRDILQGGQECLKVVIQKNVHQVAEWCDETSGKTGLELLIQFIAKLLDPSQTESAALFVGDLISKLVTKGGGLIASVLPELLNAATVRLADAKLLSFIQPLVMVFAHLCLKQHETVINFLSGVNVHGRSGLNIVLTAWLANHADFQGLYHQKVSIVALTKVITSADPRVFEIQVRGDRIASESSRRITRSKAKNAPGQYATITVPDKIVKLLVTDLANKIEEDETRGEFDEEYGDDDDEEYSDSDEEDQGDKVKDTGNDKSAFPSNHKDVQGGVGYFDNEGDEDEESDPDVLTDPVYQMKTKEFLVDFFRDLRQSPSLVQCFRELNESEKKTLSNIFDN